MHKGKNTVKKICLLLLTLGVMAFYLCFNIKEKENVPAAPVSTEEPVTMLLTAGAEYTVTYLDADGAVLYTCQVKEGGFPEEYTSVRAGLGIVGWTDENGQRVDAYTTPVSGDVTYRAVVAPLLSGHNMYLFPNRYGLIEPDEMLTYNALRDAIAALCPCAPEYLPEVKYVEPAPEEPEESEPAEEAGEVPECADDLPDVPQTEAPEDVPESEIQKDAPIPVSQIRNVFSLLYGTEELIYPESEYMSRREFARMINALTQRGEDGVSVSTGAVAYPDLDKNDPDYAAVMEAACPHVPGEKSWSEQTLAVPESGFALSGGALYYIGEDGKFVRDTDVGLLHFGADGRHTSGSEELDGYVRDILSAISYAHPDADREELLRDAYNYCRDSFKYLRKKSYKFGATGWEADDAVEMFSTGKGNCYNYAASFWALSRGLGYESVAVSGTISHTNQPHGWVIIKMDDEYCYFDTETEMTYILKGESRDMFKMKRNYYIGWSYLREVDIGI